MGCLAMFLLREALHEVELSSTFRNGLQQLTIPLHGVSPLQQLVSQFYGSFNKDVRAHFLFLVARSIARQVAENLHSVTGLQHQTSATCNTTFPTIARQVAKKLRSVTGPLRNTEQKYSLIALIAHHSK